MIHKKTEFEKRMLQSLYVVFMFKKNCDSQRCWKEEEEDGNNDNWSEMSVDNVSNIKLVLKYFSKFMEAQNVSI